MASPWSFITCRQLVLVCSNRSVFSHEHALSQCISSPFALCFLLRVVFAYRHPSVMQELPIPLRHSHMTDSHRAGSSYNVRHLMAQPWSRDSTPLNCWSLLTCCCSRTSLQSPSTAMTSSERSYGKRVSDTATRCSSNFLYSLALCWEHGWETGTFWPTEHQLRSQTCLEWVYSLPSSAMLHGPQGSSSHISLRLYLGTDLQNISFC